MLIPWMSVTVQVLTETKGTKKTAVHKKNTKRPTQYVIDWMVEVSCWWLYSELTSL